MKRASLPSSARSSHFLKPGGIFYIVEFHPFSRIFDSDSAELKVANPYFFAEEPFRFEIQGFYAAEAATPLHGYNWNHSLSEVFNALIAAGLRIECFNEFPFTLRERIAGMMQGEDGLWRLTQRRRLNARSVAGSPRRWASSEILMEVARFEDIQAEFMERVSQAVYGTLATVDRQNRPRSRVVHPIWEQQTGWVISWPASHKAKHLAYNSAVSLAYIPDKAKPVYVDAIATWIDSVEEQQRVWDLHAATTPPLGFDPQPHYGTIDHPYYGVLRLTPWRIELGNLGGEPLIWRPHHVAAG